MNVDELSMKKMSWVRSILKIQYVWCLFFYFIYGCESSSFSKSSNQCIPNQQIACACGFERAQDGTQVCNSEGTAFSDCDCSLSPDGEDTTMTMQMAGEEISQAGTQTDHQVDHHTHEDMGHANTDMTLVDEDMSQVDEDMGHANTDMSQVDEDMSQSDEDMSQAGENLSMIACGMYTCVHGNCIFNAANQENDGYECFCDLGWSGIECDQFMPPTFTTAYSQQDYQDVLTLATRFYGAQRCGNQHNWILADHPLGASCHLEDGPDHQDHLDLVGGWHDAGDFIKISLTTAWTAYVLIKSFDAFGDVWGDVDDMEYTNQANQIPDVLDEVKVATDYLMKLHPDSNTLIARVGGDQDHTLWVTSPYQSTLPIDQGGGIRPVFAGAQADIAGIMAASLALMGQVYEPYDPAYAQTCIQTAQSIYTLGQSRLGVTPDSFYPDQTWQDSMFCGAVELYRATGNESYLDDAIFYDHAIGVHYWVSGWDNNTDPCRHSLWIAGHRTTEEYWREDVNRYLTKVSNQTYINGLAWFLDWGSNRWSLNASFSASLYYQVTGEEQYRDFAISQMDYVLGQNEYQRSFVVGWGVNPPQFPHHANAYGREALDWDLTQPLLHSLQGALVGGPTLMSTGPSLPGYQDVIEDWVGNEVTNDYNASLVAVSAFLVYLHGANF